MGDLHLFSFRCPACNAECSTARAKGDPMPESGDFGLCGYCGHLLRWAGANFRSATPDEVQYIRSQDPERFDQFQQALRGVRERGEPLHPELPGKPLAQTFTVHGAGNLMPLEDGTFDWWLESGEIGNAPTVEKAVSDMLDAAIERDKPKQRSD